MHQSTDHTRWHVRRTGRPVSGMRAARPHHRALTALAAVAAVVALAAGCASTDTAGGSDASDPPSNNTAQAAKYGFVDVCRHFDAPAFSQLIDDAEPAKVDTDVDDAAAGWSACSWALDSTVLSVQFTAPERPTWSMWSDWTKQPGYGTWTTGELSEPDAWDKSDVQVAKDAKDNPAAAVVSLRRGNLGVMVRVVVWSKATSSAKLAATAEAAAAKLAAKARKQT